MARQTESTRLCASGGFALVVTLSLMVLLTIIALGLLSLSSISMRTASSGQAMATARANARMALMLAIGELQKAAGPDQRVTATASILGESGNPYAKTTTAVNGKQHWVGVWDTNGYSPADPDKKSFMRWLVSGDQVQLDALADAGTAAAADDMVIFEGVDSSGNPDPDGPDSVKVPKVEVATTPGNKSYYAYWVEDESTKADLAWNEGEFASDERKQTARLSATPGVDHGVLKGPPGALEGPFASGVSYPLEKGSGYIDQLEKALSPADMPLVVGSTDNHSTWLKAYRHDMTFASRGVMADVKKGGLRRDLSLAFEMDDAAESESARLFNQQTTEFVGSDNATDPNHADYDQLSSPYTTPGTSLYARYLFRDYGKDSSLGASGAGNPFSDDMNQPLDFVRGPSWWLLRDYANLYKHLKTSGTGHALSARAYFPNRSVTEDLVDLHSFQGSKIGVNHEAVNTYRPLRASYAPVLLAVNGIFSLKYEGDQLKLVVDPFYIIWNPYNTQITAEKFAVTWQYGFMGGVKFQHTFPDGTPAPVIHGRDSGSPAGGSKEGFVDYAKNKTGNSNNSVSYLISDLTMAPGEVMIFSPPDTAARSSNANELNDELLPGMNYTNTSGIEFNEFPDETGGNWAPITVPSGETESHTLGVHFSLIAGADWNRKNHLETSLPAPGRRPNELTTEANFGANLSGFEFSTNASGTRANPNIIKGITNFPLSYKFSELSDTKKSFAMISMLTQSSDWAFPRIDGYLDPKMEVFSQLNVTPILRTRMEKDTQQPFNLYMKAQVADGLNNLINNIGVDVDTFGDGSNSFYGKNYGLAEGDTHFPLLDVPRAPMHSLMQLLGANIGTRLFEPTNAIGNSWKPPYIPQDSIYWNSKTTFNDVSWQVNDALFDRYFFSGIAPEFTIGTGGYDRTGGSLNKTLKRFYGIDPADPTQSVDPATAQANPALEAHVPSGTTSDDIVTELTPSNANQEGYKKIAAYSLTKGAFNVNSTSVQAWAAILKGNKALALESAQGTTDTGTGTPFPLASTTSNTSSNNGWEKFSRLTDDQINTLAIEIVSQVKARGPFMSLSDFVNRRIGNDSRSYQGAIQEAIEKAGINGDENTGIRAGTSDLIPNYKAFSDKWKVSASGAQNYVSDDFPYAADPYIGNRNCATGVPTEINQANILLPIASKLSARSDTFRIRGYGEVRSADGTRILAQATCESVVQRYPEYLDPTTDAPNNEPWDEASTSATTLNAINQKFGRRFKIGRFRWLDVKEM
jgi:Tfp pilus assembly protein PilV